MQSKRQLHMSTCSPLSCLLLPSFFLIFSLLFSLNVRVHVISSLMKLRATESNRKDEERRTEFDRCENTMSIYASTVPPARSAAKRASFSAESDRIENVIFNNHRSSTSRCNTRITKFPPFQMSNILNAVKLINKLNMCINK